MRARRVKTERESTIALINIVFLMLIFFLVAGTVAAPLDKGLRLVSTNAAEGSAPADALVLHADERMSNRGKDVSSAAAFLASISEAARKRVRIMPDRALPAAKLVSISRDLRAAGAQQIVIVTERGMR